MSAGSESNSQPVCRLHLPIPASHWVALEAPCILSMPPPRSLLHCLGLPAHPAHPGWLCTLYPETGEAACFHQTADPRPSPPSKASSRSGRARSLQLVISSRTRVLKHVAQKSARPHSPPWAHRFQPLHPDSPRAGDRGPGGGRTWTTLRSSDPSHRSTEVQLQFWHDWCPPPQLDLKGGKVP